MTTTTIRDSSRTIHHRRSLIGVGAAIAALVLATVITIDRASSTDPTPSSLVVDGVTLTAPLGAMQGLVAGAVGNLDGTLHQPAPAHTPSDAVEGLVAGAVGNLTGR